MKLYRKTKIVVLFIAIAIIAVTVYYLQSSLPSLVFVDIRWEPEIIKEGYPVRFILKLANRGVLPTQTPINVYLYRYNYAGFVGPEKIGKIEASVGVNEVTLIEFTWTPSSPGFYRIKFVCETGCYLNQLIYVTPKEPKVESFAFAVFGDNRPADGVSPQPSVFKELAYEVNIIHPDFAILVGDIIYGYRSDLSRLKMQWNDFLAVYDSFEIPVFIAPGNHEMLTEEVPDSGNEDAQILYIMNMGRLYYAFTYGNSLFIILDTDIVGSASEISGEQLVWLEDMLKLRKSFVHVFVFLHKPVVSYEGADILNNHYQIKPLLLKYNVSAVFQGHNHMYYYKRVNNTEFYVTGGAGAPLYVSEERGGVHHFLLVEVKGSKFEVKFIPVYSLNVKKGEDYITVEYNFREKMIFRRGGYAWVGEPKSLELKGLWFETSKEKVDVNGGSIFEVIDLDGVKRVYIKVDITPGGRREIRIENSS